MAAIEKTVFISYRRANFPWALAVYQHLTAHHFDVFFDFNGIASGDFEQVILGNVRSRAHFLVLLTPSALERCHQPGDWFRREIEAALASRRNIVPLLLERFDFDAPGVAAQLTGPLALLRRYNGLGVPPEYFDAAMDKLRQKFLRVALDDVPHPSSPMAQSAALAQQAAAASAPPVSPDSLSAQDWYERGYRMAAVDEKLRCFGEAIRLDPGFAYAYNNRGFARSEKGDLAGALHDYDEALRLRPDLVLVYNNRGNARRKQGDLAGAVADFEVAIRLKPQDAMAYNNRGVARRNLGDLAGELQDYATAIRLNPNDGLAFYNRGRAKRAAGDPAGAVLDFNDAIRANPADAKAYNQRGLAKRDLGDDTGAAIDTAQAQRLRGATPA